MPNNVFNGKNQDLSDTPMKKSVRIDESYINNQTPRRTSIYSNDYSPGSNYSQKSKSILKPKKSNSDAYEHTLGENLNQTR